MSRKRNSLPPIVSPWIESRSNQYVRVCCYGMYTIDSRQTPITIAYLPKTSGAKYTIRYTLADTVADAMQACEHEIGEFGLGHQLLMESQQG